MITLSNILGFVAGVVVYIVLIRPMIKFFIKKGILK